MIVVNRHPLLLLLVGSQMVKRNPLRTHVVPTRNCNFEVNKRGGDITSAEK